MGANEPAPSKQQFRVRLNGMSVPELNIRGLVDGGWELVVCIDDIGWIVVDDRPEMALEFRDETSWALLPIPMRQASVDKGWQRTSPRELMEILEFADAIE